MLPPLGREASTHKARAESTDSRLGAVISAELIQDVPDMGFDSSHGDV